MSPPKPSTSTSPSPSKPSTPSSPKASTTSNNTMSVPITTVTSPTSPSPITPKQVAGFDEASKDTHFTAEEISRLHKRFLKLDKDSSGTISKDEFLSIPSLANNPLCSRLIAIFDEDNGGDVDFGEFLRGLSVFSGKGNKREKLRFAFKVYDIDRDSYISNGELFIVLKMMVGNNLRDGQLQQIVDKTIMEADLDGDGKLSFEEFEKLVENTDIARQMTLESF